MGINDQTCTAGKKKKKKEILSFSMGNCFIMHYI